MKKKYTHTKEWKQMMSKLMMGNKHTLGFKHSEKSKKKISENNVRYWLGKKRPDISEKLRIANIGKVHSLSQKMKISLSLKKAQQKSSWGFKKGHKHSEEWKKMMSKKLGNENSPFWKGDNVGYVALHDWVRKYLGTPDTCEHCGKTNLKGRQIHWANIDHKYLRNLIDWIRLCVKCHKTYDLNLVKQ